MAIFSPILNAVITENGTTGPVIVSAVANQLQLLVIGTFTGNIQPEISFDGVNFLAEGSAITAAGRTALPSCHTVRLVTTGLSAGTPRVTIGGLLKQEN